MGLGGRVATNSRSRNQIICDCECNGDGMWSSLIFKIFLKALEKAKILDRESI